MQPAFFKRLLLFLAVLLMLAGTFATTSPASAAGKTAEYIVQPGDTLKKIADHYEITVAQILAVNPKIKDPNLIYTGQVVILPVGRGEGVKGTKETRLFVWQMEKDGGRVEKSDRLYLVGNGDNLTRIAKRFGVTLEAMQAVNPAISDPNLLFRGELVHIPEVGLAETAPSFYESPRDTSSK